METYTFLRALADSWFLLAMLLFFLGIVLYTLRPGSRATHDDIADIPLRHADAPVPDVSADKPAEKEARHG
ncbi:MAG: cbb3-type cytochrome c oxidase subunit 3 [Pseudomonadota bacterium]